MYDITENEYRNLDRFKSIVRHSAPERLLRYRRNVIVLGSSVVFYYLAGIEVEEFTGGFIKGKILNPDLLSPLFPLIFPYNLFMLYVYLRREIGVHNFKVDNLQSFGIGVAHHIIKREIGKLFPSQDAGNEYEPKNFSLRGNAQNDVVNAQFTLDPEIRTINEERIKLLPGFTLDKHAVNFDYEISEADKKFYGNNKDLLKNTAAHEFMDFKFPKYLGVSATLIIISIEFLRALQAVLA